MLPKLLFHCLPEISFLLDFLALLRRFIKLSQILCLPLHNAAQMGTTRQLLRYVIPFPSRLQGLFYKLRPLATKKSQVFPGTCPLFRIM